MEASTWWPVRCSRDATRDRHPRAAIRNRRATRREPRCAWLRATVQRDALRVWRAELPWLLEDRASGQRVEQGGERGDRQRDADPARRECSRRQDRAAEHVPSNLTAAHHPP